MLEDRVREMTGAWAEALDNYKAEQLASACEVLESICKFVDDL